MSASGRYVHDARAADRRRPANASSSGRMSSASRARSRSRSRSPRRTTRRRNWRAKICRAAASCSIPSSSCFTCGPTTTSACKASAWSGRASPATWSRSRPRAKRMLAVGGHDKAALDVQGTFTAKSLGIEPQPIELRIVRDRLFPGSQAGLHRAVRSLRAQRRAARDLDHRAAGQVASPIARSPRPRVAALRNEQAAARHVAGGARPPGNAAADRTAGRRRAGQRSPAGESDRGRQRPAAAGGPQSRRSASAISTSGPRCCRSWRTSRPTACRRSPTC